VHRGDGLRNNIQFANIENEHGRASGHTELLPAQHRILLAQAIAPLALQSQQVQRIVNRFCVQARRDPEVRHTAGANDARRWRSPAECAYL
jgi:hypothetical protein